MLIISHSEIFDYSVLFSKQFGTNKQKYVVHLQQRVMLTAVSGKLLAAESMKPSTLFLLHVIVPGEIKTQDHRRHNQCVSRSIISAMLNI